MRKLLISEYQNIYSGLEMVSLPSFSRIVDIVLNPYENSFRVIYEVDNSRIITSSDFVNSLWIKFIKISEILYNNNDYIIGEEYQFLKRVDNINSTQVFSGSYNQFSVDSIIGLNIPESILIYTYYVKCHQEVRSDRLKKILQNDFSN